MFRTLNGLATVSDLFQRVGLLVLLILEDSVPASEDRLDFPTKIQRHH